MSKGSITDLMVLKQKFFDALNSGDKNTAIRIFNLIDSKCLELSNVSLNNILTDEQKEKISSVLGKGLFEDKSAVK